jgi:hypothetical protein
MVQNVQHWLLDRNQFTWARRHVPEAKWYQVTKYFPGYKLRRQMVYVDAETGQTVSAEGGEQVPQGRVFIYGYDLRNFCGIDVPGLQDAMTATRKSRMEARSTHGDAAAGSAAAPAAPAPNEGAPAAGATAGTSKA